MHNAHKNGLVLVSPVLLLPLVVHFTRVFICQRISPFGNSGTKHTFAIAEIAANFANKG
jgi:hypothetical protein